MTPGNNSIPFPTSQNSFNNSSQPAFALSWVCLATPARDKNSCKERTDINLLSHWAAEWQSDSWKKTKFGPLIFLSERGQRPQDQPHQCVVHFRFILLACTMFVYMCGHVCIDRVRLYVRVCVCASICLRLLMPTGSRTSRGNYHIGNVVSNNNHLMENHIVESTLRSSHTSKTCG